MEGLLSVLQDDEVASIKQRWSKAPLRIGTVCSGTDAPILALGDLLSILNRNDGCHKKIHIEHVFSCEHVPFKREFITQTTNPPLLFNDLMEISSKSMRGVCHDGKTKEVPQDFHVLIAGTECVDFSSLSTSQKGLKGGGRSDKTFWATHELARVRRPAIVILENVAKCPADEMKRAFEKIGYIAVHTKLCTSNYLLPQTRSRAYFVFLHSKKARFASSCTEDDWVGTMERLGINRQLQQDTKSRGWTEFLINKTNTTKDTTKKRKAGRGKPLSESLNSKWLAEIKSIEKKERLTRYNARGGRPYSNATKNVPAIASLPDRAKLRLDVQCKRAIKAGINPFEVPLLWNPAQQLRFTDSGISPADGEPRTVAPCITPKHEWIVSSRMGPLTGAEALALQGISSLPDEVLARFDCSQLRDLAGNCMSTTVVAAVFLSLFLTAELVDGGTHEKKKSSTAQPKRTKRRRVS